MGDSLNEGRVSTSSSGTDSPSPVQSPSPVILHHHVPPAAPLPAPAPASCCSGQLSAASVVSLNMAALTLTPQQKHRGGGAGSSGGSGGGGLMTSSTYPAPPLVAYGDQMRLTSVTGPPSQYVKLNVGGCLHYTTIATLTKHDSMLRAMFSGRLEVLTDSEGWVLIDRCGKHFPVVLNFLRDGAVALPESRREILEILAEAKYYCIQSLIDLCQAWLEVTQKSEDNLPVCKIPIITSSKEEKALLQSTTRPAIKLLLNRHNNKYSYTSQSDDNLLKNLELFDKLIMRFHERVLFIKDVGAANEVCSWTFYGHGRKVTEVCCTSIVYATDKKHTKVEFPEARIYEEAMNILLYEPEQLCPSCMSFSLNGTTGGGNGGAGVGGCSGVNGCTGGGQSGNSACNAGDDCAMLSGYCSDREHSCQQKTRTVTRAAEV